MGSARAVILVALSAAVGACASGRVVVAPVAMRALTPSTTVPLAATQAPAPQVAADAHRVGSDAVQAGARMVDVGMVGAGLLGVIGAAGAGASVVGAGVDGAALNAKPQRPASATAATLNEAHAAVPQATVTGADVKASAAASGRHDPDRDGWTTWGAGAGGYYLDDGPGDRALPPLAALADAEPRPEALHSSANRPYRLFGRTYVPMTTRSEFSERGVASWYGRKFHGRPTATGEPYDMYAMTAAHPTLPLPSYARVTHLNTGRSVVVRVNDRGPFLRDRVIDLSAAAAHRLGYLKAGSAPVQVELITTAAAEQPTLVGASRSGATTPAGASGSAVTTPPGASAAHAVTAMRTSTSAVRPGAGLAASAGHFLQLAALSSRPAAEAAYQDLRRRFDWLPVPMQLVQSDDIFRIRAGPFGDRQQASVVARQIERTTGQRPWIVAPP